MANVAVIQYADDGTGTPLDPQPYAVRAPAQTNRLTYSDDLTNAAWTKTNGAVAKDAVGIMGAPNGACPLTASAANCTCIRAAAFTAASGTHSTRWYIKRKTGTGAVELTVDGGATWQAVTSEINASTFVAVAIQQTTLVNPRVGIRLVTSGDAVVVSNVGLYSATEKAKLVGGFPIYTTTAAGTRDKDAISMSRANLLDAQGSLYCETDLGPAESTGILSLFLARVASNVEFQDGTTAISAAVVEGANKLGAVWGGGTRDFNLNGSWIGEEAHDGSLSDTVLDIFRNSAYPQKMRNLKVWDVKSKDAIDAEMV